MDGEGEENDAFLQWLAKCPTGQNKLKRTYRFWKNSGTIRVSIKGWGLTRDSALTDNPRGICCRRGP